MERTRYIEKSTGKWWKRTMWSNSSTEGVEITLAEWDDKERKTEICLSEKEVEERFEFKPFPKVIMNIEDVVPRHPIHIVLRCPECGSILKSDGGAICTYPLQYEHSCSNKDCQYGKCTKSYYSGMYALVTDEQEQKLKDGTYNELKDGKLIRVEQSDLWSFKIGY